MVLPSAYSSSHPIPIPVVQYVQVPIYLRHSIDIKCKYAELKEEQKKKKSFWHKQALWPNIRRTWNKSIVDSIDPLFHYQIFTYLFQHIYMHV